MSHQYQVQAGDTLVSISIRENVTVAALRKLNKLYGNEIYAGQILLLRTRTSIDNSRASATAQESVLETKQENSVFKNVSKATTTVLNNEMVESVGVKIRKSELPPTTSDNVEEYFIPTVMDIPVNIPFLSSNVEDDQQPLFGTTRKRDNSIVTRKRGESTCLPPTLLGEGILLSIERAVQLRSCLPVRLQIENWRLLYSVLNDGADLQTFFRKTRGYQFSVLIIETLKGECFGGFTASEWTTSPNFCK